MLQTTQRSSAKRQANDERRPGALKEPLATLTHTASVCSAAAHRVLSRSCPPSPSLPTVLDACVLVCAVLPAFALAGRSRRVQRRRGSLALALFVFVLNNTIRDTKLA